MSDYTPDRWVLVEVQSSKGPYLKVFGSWAGGYLGSDSWKLSSGTTGVQREGSSFVLPQESGSTYYVGEGGHGTTGYGGAVLAGFLEKFPEKLRVLPEEEALARLEELADPAE